MKTPSKQIVELIVRKMFEEQQKNNYALIYKSEDKETGNTQVNLSALSESIWFDLKFDAKYGK